MSSVSWTSTTSGTWSTGANWDNGVPQRGDDVTINTSAALTVTYASGSTILDTLFTGATDTLAMTGGTLAVLNGYTIDGALTIAAGSNLKLVAGNAGNVIGGPLTMTGGALTLNDGVNFQSPVTLSGGTLTFNGNGSARGSAFNQAAGNTIAINRGGFTDNDTAGTLGGTITGAGEMIFAAQGTVVLQSGFVLSTGAATIASGTVLLQEGLSYANNFSLFGTLDMASHAVTLSGHAALDGVLNGGSLTASGDGHLNGLVLDNGATATLAGTYRQTGNIQLGGNTGTGTLTNSGTLRITGNDNIYQGSNAGLLNNTGLIEKTAGSSNTGTTVIYDAINNTGTILADTGTIDFRAPTGGAASTITGTLGGSAGTIAFDNGSFILGGKKPLVVNSHRLLIAGNTASTNITLASALTYGNSWEQTGGLLLLQNNLTLTGTAAWDGGELKGTATVTDSGPLHLGSGMDLEGNLTFALNGPIDQTGGINLGALSDSIDTAVLAAGQSWMLEGNSAISGAYGTITTLAGSLFAKANGAGNDIVQSTLFNSGTLAVDSGTLSLTGQGTLGGSVIGPAVLDLSGQFALAAGMALSVGELILDNPAQTGDVQATLGGDLTFANTYAQEGGTLALAGHTLTLSGTSSFDTGAILGAGEVIVNGPSVIQNVALNQGGTLLLQHSVEQTGNVLLTGGQTAPNVIIAAGSVYTMDSGVSIGGPGNSVVGTVTVNGTLVAAGAGTSVIAANIVDNGAIKISHGEMQFLGPLSGAGSLQISAGGILDLDNNASTTTGITFGAGAGTLFLQTPSSYAGTIGGFASGDAVELGGFAFTGAVIEPPSGNTVTITETGGPSVTLHFSTAQTAASLVLGVGPHGGVALIHT